MAQKTRENNGFGKVQGFVARKHNLAVLRCLLGNPHGTGFNGMMKACSPITPRILSTRLKELEKEKFLSKGLVFGTPPKIEYRATAKAEGLRKIIAELEEWGKKELA